MVTSHLNSTLKSSEGEKGGFSVFTRVRRWHSAVAHFAFILKINTHNQLNEGKLMEKNVNYDL